MKFLEKDLEQIIFEADNDQLQERGLNISGKKLRQVTIGNYGVADLITFERDYVEPWRGHSIKVTVYELKKENINISTFLQALGYLRGIQRYLDRGRFVYDTVNYGIVCIGKTIDTSSAYTYLPEFLISETFTLKNYTYDFKIDGISFEDHEGFKLVKEGF